MDDDSGSIGSRRFIFVVLTILGCAALTVFLGSPFDLGGDPSGQAWAQGTGEAHLDDAPQVFWAVVKDNLSPATVSFLLLLIALSAFFSGTEVAFFSLHQVQLRGMSEDGKLTSRVVANLMSRPQRLLTTILIGNMIVNVLISIVLPLRLERIIEAGLHVPPVLSYFVTVTASTVILVFFGEVTPKIFAVRLGLPFARAVALPLQAVDKILTPVRWCAVRFTEFVFRITGFDDIQPAPFITDEEFISVLSDSEAQGVIEQEEGQMIQSIIEYGDAFVREILIPRPDVVAIEHTATVGEARELFRVHGFSRMPVYEEDLDHITGVLVVKDLLQSIAEDGLDRPIGPLSRRASFIPETMTLREYVKDAQRKRMHLSIVVDEYGGTEGVATLEDAIEEVVGDIGANNETVSPVEPLGDATYQVDGSLPLDDLRELLSVDLDDSEHETVAGFFIDHTNKVPEKGDSMTHEGILFTVVRVDGKRASLLRVRVLNSAEREQSA